MGTEVLDEPNCFGELQECSHNAPLSSDKVDPQQLLNSRPSVVSSACGTAGSSRNASWCSYSDNNGDVQQLEDILEYLGFGDNTAELTPEQLLAQIRKSNHAFLASLPEESPLLTLGADFGLESGNTSQASSRGSYASN